jgi:hypothetical protein
MLGNDGQGPSFPTYQHSPQTNPAAHSSNLPQLVDQELSGSSGSSKPCTASHLSSFRQCLSCPRKTAHRCTKGQLTKLPYPPERHHGRVKLILSTYIHEKRCAIKAIDDLQASNALATTSTSTQVAQTHAGQTPCVALHVILVTP